MIISVDADNKLMRTKNCEFNFEVEILELLTEKLEEGIALRANMVD